MIGRQCLYVLRKNPLKASALNEDKPKAPDEFSTATPEVERERVFPENLQTLPPDHRLCLPRRLSPDAALFMPVFLRNITD